MLLQTRRDRRVLLALKREASALGVSEVHVPQRPRSVDGVYDGLRQTLGAAELNEELVASRANDCARSPEARLEASLTVAQVQGLLLN